MPEGLLGPLIQSLWQGETRAIDSPAEIDVVGHRIVHGGPKYRESVWITPEVRAGIAQQAEFAPAHNRLQLAGIETVDRVIGTGRTPGRGLRHWISRHAGTGRLRLSRAL